MTTLRDLPAGHYILAALDDGTLAAVPDGDPFGDVARRWKDGKRENGDEAAIRAWLWTHPQYRILPTPAGPLPEECTQLALWEAA